MFLTRAILDPEHPDVRRDLRNPEDLHRTVMRAFPRSEAPSPRREYGVLHRVDEHGGRLVLLIQSQTEPDPSRWPNGYLLAPERDIDFALVDAGSNPSVRSLEGDRHSLRTGRRLIFRLRANTTRRVDTKTREEGVRRHGRRVPLRDDEARIAWLERQAKRAGFTVDRSRLRLREVALSRGRRVTFEGTVFEGVLEIIDEERFRAALAEGLGPAKAFGFGLLSLAVPR
jgi:CRISPR system Cascade subunit CasE